MALAACGAVGTAQRTVTRATATVPPRGYREAGACSWRVGARTGAQIMRLVCTARIRELYRTNEVYTPLLVNVKVVV